MPSCARVPSSSGPAAHPHGSLLPRTRTEVSSHRGWQLRQLHAHDSCLRNHALKFCCGCLCSQLECHVTNRRQFGLCSPGGQPLPCGRGRAGSRSCCPQVALQAPGWYLPQRSLPAWRGCSQLRCWGCQVGEGGLAHLAHRRPPTLCPLCCVPHIPPCVPLPVSHVPCPPLPVSRVPLPVSHVPSLCPPMSCAPSPCVPCPRVLCVLHSPCQWTVRPSLWTTAPRRRPPPLADPPPLCCPPPDAVTGLGVSLPSTRVGQVHWQQPLGLWGQPNPGSSCASGNRACWAPSPLLAGRHLTGGRGVSPEATQPAGASGAQVHPHTCGVDAGPRPGCGHVHPSVRPSEECLFSVSVTVSCPVVSVCIPCQVS